MSPRTSYPHPIRSWDLDFVGKDMAVAAWVPRSLWDAVLTECSRNLPFRVSGIAITEMEELPHLLEGTGRSCWPLNATWPPCSAASGCWKVVRAAEGCWRSRTAGGGYWRSHVHCRSLLNWHTSIWKENPSSSNGSGTPYRQNCTLRLLLKEKDLKDPAPFSWWMWIWSQKQ